MINKPLKMIEIHMLDGRIIVISNVKNVKLINERFVSISSKEQGVNSEKYSTTVINLNQTKFYTVEELTYM